MDAVETIERDGFTIELFYDEASGDDSPRDWDNCSILAQLSDRFTQPDKSDSRADALIAAWGRYDRDIVKVERYARAFLNAVAIDWWDDSRSASRVVGMIDRETAEREQLPDAVATLKAELATYASWADGEVYYWTVTGPDGQSDSCGGYIGEPEYALSEANGSVDWHLAQRTQEQAARAAIQHAERVAMYRSLVN